MPVRVRITRFQSGPHEVQVPDGWVDIKHLTNEEAKAFQEAFAAPPFAGDADDEEAVAAHQKLVLEHADVEGGKFLAQVVLKWNWCGDDGSELPQPFENPAVFKKLIAPELNFITDCIAGEIERVQKKAKPSQKR